MESPSESAWRASLSALLDGEDPALPMADIAAHLDSCPDCSAWLDRAASVNARFGLLPVVQPDLGEQVVNSVDVHLCPCRTGGRCQCRDCQCGPQCTCRAPARS